MSKTVKQRDYNIEKSFKKELNLSTKSCKPKTQYQRKDKYKSSFHEGH